MMPEYLQLNPKHRMPVLVIDEHAASSTLPSKPGSPGISQRRGYFPPTRCWN
jgi:hypothetical protein